MSRKKIKMDNFETILKRIEPITGIKNAAQLSRIINIPQPTVNRRKNKNEFPVEWAYKIASQYELLTEWVLTGREPKSLNDINKNQPQKETEEDCPGQWVECWRNKTKVKKVKIQKGGIYIIDPINPNNTKHRGKRVKLVNYDILEGCEVLLIESKKDKKKITYLEIDICDLTNE